MGEATAAEVGYIARRRSKITRLDERYCWKVEEESSFPYDTVYVQKV